MLTTTNYYFEDKSDNSLTGDYTFQCIYCGKVTDVVTTGNIPEEKALVECIHCGKKNKVIDRYAILVVTNKGKENV